MHNISTSGKGRYHGDEPHPYIKRVVDRLPAGRLLLTGETAGHHAAYAVEAGWEVYAVGFRPEDQQQSQALAREKKIDIHFQLYQPGTRFCQGLSFDAAILLFVHLPQEVRQTFHQDVVRCLKPDGGNLYLIAYSENQPEGTAARLPDIRYNQAMLMEDFKDLQIDLLQEETEKQPDSGEKVKLINLTAVRNSEHDSRDEVTITLES